MKLKVMIADDEILVRVGIKTMIPWEKYGFELVAEAESGKVALDLALALKPDIVITDIKMPVLNGVELIAALQEKLKGTKYLVLSSYGDFEFVKEAMRLGAEDYILKLKMEPDQLIELLNKIKKKIEEDRSIQEEQFKEEWNKRQHRPALQGKMFQDLLFRYFVKDDEIREQCEYLNIHLDFDHLLCILLQVEGSEMYEKYDDDDRYILTYGITNVLEEILQNYPYSYVSSINSMEFVILCSFKDFTDDGAKEVAEKAAKHMKNALKTFLNISCRIGISACCGHLREFKTAYQQAGEALRRGFSNRSRTIFHYEPDTVGKLLTAEFEEEFIAIEKSLLLHDTALFEEVMVQFLQKIDDGNIIKSEETLRGICWSLALMVKALSKEIQEDVSDLLALCSRIEHFRNLDDYRYWILACKTKILGLMNQIHNGRNLIERARKHMEENYDKEISLGSVSGYLNISPNYLSALFKRETDENFIDFLVRKRIDQAKQLLKSTQLKIYEVGMKVGYNDAYYFSKIFKKVTGQTPQQYRN